MPKRAIAAWACVLLMIPWAIGQVFRDYGWWTALAFYLPSPLVGLALFIGAGFAWWSGRRRLALACGLLAVGPIYFVGCVENRWTAPAIVEANHGTLRLVHWNVQSGAWGWDGIQQHLQDQAADIIVLSETPDWADLAALGAEYRHVRLNNLSVLMRDYPLPESRGLAMTQGDAFLVRWPDRLSLLIVDLPSSPWIEREPLLEQVRQHMVELRPDVVVGDCNAPRRSRVLTRLPPGYVHAYDQAGSGWSYTWPAPLPMWAIDQCILGPRVAAQRYALHTTTASDHRLQVVDFSIRP